VEQRLKERLFGAVVIISLIIIFVPMLLKGSHKKQEFEKQLPILPHIIVSEKDFIAPKKLLVLAKSLEDKKLTKVEITKSVNSKKVVHRKTVENSAKSSKIWVVQLASFSKPQNAKNLIVKLQQQGMPAYTRKVSGTKGQIIQVFVGPELERNKALKLQAQLKNNFKLDGLVIRYQPIKS